MPGPKSSPIAIPAGIWVLGCVSLLMDVSSELVPSLLPVFMVTALGISPLALIGYGLSAQVKPLFAPAPSAGWIFAARCAHCRSGAGRRAWRERARYGLGGHSASIAPQRRLAASGRSAGATPAPGAAAGATA
jgi:hypothetical protein